MRSLVTGGAGFIGSHLVDHLLDLGHEVVVLDDFRRGNKLGARARQEAEVRCGDVRDKQTVVDAAWRCDMIFHLAAVLGVDCVAAHPLETMETEALAMINVARAAAVHGVGKIVYASTSGIYGRLAVDCAVTEEAPVSPKSGYAVAKHFGEHYLEAVFEERRCPSAAIRYFNVYGPRQDSRMVIPRFFGQALAGEPITVYGTGDQTRDFTFVSDAVEATVRLAYAARTNDLFNVAHGEEASISTLAQKIATLTRSSSRITMLEPPASRRPFEVERRFGSSQKLADVIGYMPATTLDEGLEAIYADLKAASQARTYGFEAPKALHA